MSHQLEADGIMLSFGSRTILDGIYIQCETNKITGLLGRNGQGKTCLLNIIYGSLKAQSRSIRFDDQSIFEAFKRPDLLTYLPQFNFIPASLSLKRVFNDFNLSFSDFESFSAFFSPKPTCAATYPSCSFDFTCVTTPGMMLTTVAGKTCPPLAKNWVICCFLPNINFI